MSCNIKILCDKCGKEISKNNYNKHYVSCKRPKKKKIRGIDFDPNIGYKNGTREGWNKGQTKETNAAIAKYAKTQSEQYKSGDRELSYWFTPEYRQTALYKERCKKGGGYRERSGRSKKFYIIDSYNNEVCLQSSYELKCANILDDLGIKWIRPKYLLYDDRKYFPDFYLVDYDVYLDPKNDYKAKCDEEKIKKVILQNDIELYIVLNKDLTYEFFIELTSVPKPLA